MHAAEEFLPVGGEMDGEGGITGQGEGMPYRKFQTGESLSRRINLLGITDDEGPGRLLSRPGDQAGEIAVQVVSGWGLRDLPDGGGDQQGAQVGTITRFVETNQQRHGKMSGQKSGVGQEVTAEDRVR